MVPSLSSLRTRFVRFQLLSISVWSKSIANLLRIYSKSESVAKANPLEYRSYLSCRAVVAKPAPRTARP
jgi:hypothetical protein